MSNKTAYEIAKELKEKLEERKLISPEFKRKAVGMEHAHTANIKEFDNNAAEILWLLVNKFSKESAENIKGEKKLTQKIIRPRVMESADNDNEFDDEEYNIFMSKIKKLADNAAAKYVLLNELWNFRTGLLVNLIVEKINVKLTFKILNMFLAAELDINEKDILNWLLSVNKVFAISVFSEGEPDKIIVYLEKLIASDPLRESMIHLKKTLSPELLENKLNAEQVQEDIFADFENLKDENEEVTLKGKTDKYK